MLNKNMEKIFGKFYMKNKTFFLIKKWVYGEMVITFDC